MAHFVASDADNITTEPFYMKEAYDKLEKEFDKQKVYEFKQVTKNLIIGERIIINLSKQVKQSKFPGLF